MDKTITINGVDFKVVRPTTKEGISIINDVRYSDHKDLYDIYDRPSETKRDIWRGWCEWLKGVSDTNIWCLRGSSHAFSIAGNIELDGVKGYLYITKSYNKVIMEG